MGETVGTLDFHVAPFEQANSLLPRHPDDPSRETKVPVQVVRIEDYAREQNIDRVEILKLDIEGVEFSAIHGCGRLIDDHGIGVPYCESCCDEGRARGGSNTTPPDLCGCLVPRGSGFAGNDGVQHTASVESDWTDVDLASKQRLRDDHERA